MEQLGDLLGQQIIIMTSISSRQWILLYWISFVWFLERPGIWEQHRDSAVPSVKLHKCHRKCCTLVQNMFTGQWKTS